MSETGTIEYCIKYAMRHGCMVTSEAAAELAAAQRTIDEARLYMTWIIECENDDHETYNQTLAMMRSWLKNNPA